MAGVLRGRRVGVFALGFSQLSTAFLCTLMVITLTSQDVQAGIWDPEEEISTDLPPGWQRYPSIGVDGDKVHIVWEDGTDGDIDIYYRHFNGTEWQPEMEISRDFGSEIQVSPIIAVDGDRIYAVWESWRDGDSDIIFRFFNGTDWQPEQEISSDITSESQWDPSITAEGGRAYAVWEDRGGGDLDIYYRHFNGTAWEPEVEISSDAANEDQRKPSVAVEGGKVYVVWEDREDGDFDIYYRHFNGTAWEPEREVSMDVGNDHQRNPSVSIEGGEVHVAWEHKEGLNYDINYRLYNGTDWELVLEISSDTDSEVQRYPSITADGGRVHVAWMDTKGGDVDIYYRSFDGANWQSEMEVSTDIGEEYQWNPSIASNGSRVHIAWHDRGGGDGDVYYRHFNGTTWQPRQKISTDVVQEEQRNPSISVRGREVYVVWEDPEDGDSDIYYRYFDGTEWQLEEEISIDGGVEPQTSPSVAADGVMVHIVWQDLGDGDADIYYRRFNGTAWEPEREVSTDVGTEDQLNPSVFAWNGRVHVVWEDLGDGDPDIYYRYYNGTAWESEQEVSSDLGNEPQSNPSIATEDGQVHIVWENQGDGDADIYYRLFNGTAWEPEQEISSDVGTETQAKPSIAATASMVHVVWEDQGGGDIDISYRLFNGTGWEIEQEISNDSGAELQSNPSVSVENVKAYVVWSDAGDGDKDIYFRHHNGTSWEMPVEISTDENAEEQSSPSIGVYNGISHVVWLDWEDGDADVYYKRGRIEDFTPPESEASIIAPHWRTTPIFNVYWTVTDDHNLANISLFYRYSADNSSSPVWMWKEWAYDNSITGTSASGSFSFGAP
ncbi:MAG: TolB family protein, partial [Candidatus Thorarchaeota archaeon]